jgi:hypothetical protein
MITAPSLITDMDIQAYFDKELSKKDEERITKELEQSPSLRQRFKELQHQHELLKKWWLMNMN